VHSKRKISIGELMRLHVRKHQSHPIQPPHSRHCPRDIRHVSIIVTA
jgi:hypothetical protein